MHTSSEAELCVRTLSCLIISVRLLMFLFFCLLAKAATVVRCWFLYTNTRVHLSQTVAYMYPTKYKAFSENGVFLQNFNLHRMCWCLCVCVRAQKSTICALSRGSCCFCYFIPFSTKADCISHFVHESANLFFSRSRCRSIWCVCLCVLNVKCERACVNLN